MANQMTSSRRGMANVEKVFFESKMLYHSAPANIIYHTNKAVNFITNDIHRFSYIYREVNVQFTLFTTWGDY